MITIFSLWPVLLFPFIAPLAIPGLFVPIWIAALGISWFSTRRSKRLTKAGFIFEMSLIAYALVMFAVLLYCVFGHSVTGALKHPVDSYLTWLAAFKHPFN
jgi:hypothetical protein